MAIYSFVQNMKLKAVTFLEESQYRYVVYKHYKDNYAVMFYAVVDKKTEFEDKGAINWIHTIEHACKFETFEEARDIADLRDAKVGIMSQ